MNGTSVITHSFGFRSWLVVLVVGMLTGCATYVEPPPPPPPPPPPVAYEPPPPPPPPAAPDVVEVQEPSDFYAPLDPYGRWVVIAPYGRVWYPSGVEAGWRPYCYGHWECTDAGWYWVGDEPWGWATYHYGRWVADPTYGWVWVPQTQWAPAWVAWREGGGYCGWAPLGFDARIGFGGSFSVGVIAPGAFVFVQERNFCEPVRPAAVIINRTTVINQTVNITKVQVVNNRVVNVGPRREVIERASGRTIQTVSVNALRRQQERAVIAKQPRVKALYQARAAHNPSGSESRRQTTAQPEKARRGEGEKTPKEQHQATGQKPQPKPEASKQKQGTESKQKAAREKQKKKPQPEESGQSKKRESEP